MIRLRRRHVSASAVPSRPFRLSAVAGAAALAVGATMALTSCAVGPSCSSNYSGQSTDDAGGAAAAAANAGNVNGAALADPRGPLTVHPGGPPALAQPASAKMPSSATITLVTGDRVQLDMTPSGQVATPALAPAQGVHATGSPGFVRFTWGGDQYVIPDAAVPYIGSTLDLRLFDASYLARAGLDDAHAASVPLQVSGDAAALPGLHATGRTGGAEAATLAKTQAPAVGRLLASAWRSRTRSPALSRLGSIALAPPKGAPELPTLPASPAQLPTAGTNKQHWHTLTLKFIGRDGTPGTGIGWVQNLGDARLGTVLVNSDDPSAGVPPVTGATGPVSFSVPDGTYSIEVSVLTPHDGTVNGTDAALVVVPQLGVHADQTVVLDARTATPYQAAIEPAIDTPVRIDEIDVWRASVTGGGCGGGGGGGQSLGLVSGIGAGYSPSVIAATPTAKVTQGRLGFEAVSLLHTGPGVATPTPDPRYFLVFPSEGTIPSSLNYTVSAAKLTTVHSHIYDNANAGCADAAPELWPNLYFPWGAFEEVRASGSPEGVNLSNVPPGDHTDYWYAGDPKLVAFQSASIYYNGTECFDGGIRYGARRTIQPGGQIDETWNKAPEVPSSTSIPDFGALGVPPYPTSQQGIDSTVAPATRQDDNGMVYLLRGGDSDPSHYMDDVSTHSLTFTRDGEVALSAPYNTTLKGAFAAPFRLDLPLVHRPATYKLDWTTQRYFTAADLSGTTETAWTFHSSPTDPHADMPDGEHCSPDTSRSCSFLPLMFLHYSLALDFNSQARAGKPLPITFTVSGQQGAPAPSGVSATVSESFDGGTTWTTPVPATSTGDNAFTATVDQPPLDQTNGSVYLKVHAADQAGNSIDQTMTPAYGLTGGEA